MAENVFDLDSLEMLRKVHPAWRLLMADSAPLVISFLYKAFIKPNSRGISQPELVSLLEDELYYLRNQRGEDFFPRSAKEYLDDWADEEKGWLRKFYPPGTDLCSYDITPGIEKAVLWLQGLSQRSFVGTESRLMTVFELLKQVVEGAKTDPETRIADLEQKKKDIDREIALVKSGRLSPMDEGAIRERFIQATDMATALLSDFREVEQNFHNLDRETRENITRWEGAKGSLVEKILEARDAIGNSDQGRSFQAFWDFLMSPDKQTRLGDLLEEVLALPAVTQLGPNKNLKRIHYDWLEAGEHTQRTVAQLSHQLRKFLDDQVWLENRRIIDILHHIETQALQLKGGIPGSFSLEIDAAAPLLRFPMERALHSPPWRAALHQIQVDLGTSDESELLFHQIVIDKEVLKERIRRSMDDHSQTTLEGVMVRFPLEHGLAEVVTYLVLAAETPQTLYDETKSFQAVWTYQGRVRTAGLPQIIFQRGTL